MATLGIDLGTTNSACSIWKDGKAILVPNRLGQSITPSVVGLDDDGELLIGETAKNRLVSHPKKTTSLFKRYMGTQYSTKLGNKTFSAIELSSLVLKSLKEDAEAFLGESITDAVISVPAYFNDLQRKATKVAGEIAGLNVERLINEPTAASIVYGLHDRNDGAQFLILDLGGGTFDVSLVEYFDGVIEVHASAGDNNLGGEDFLMLLVNDYLTFTGIKKSSLSANELRQLMHAIEEVKCELSKEGQCVLENVLSKQTAPWKITRERFGEITQDLLSRLRLPIERTILDADVELSDIDEVILVGGATRMQPFRTLVSKMFRRIPLCNIDPDIVVGLGAGVQAGLRDNHSDLDDVVLTDVSPYSLGVEIVNHNEGSSRDGGIFLPIIERNTTVPNSIVKSLCTVSDNQEFLVVSVFQGESRLVKNNVFLGKLEAKVPRAPAGQESIDVRYSYDMNGLLEVDISVPSTGVTYHKEIVNAQISLSDADIFKAKERLALLKFHPREQEENRLLLTKGDRLFESSLGERRDYITQIISNFEQVLEGQNVTEIIQARATFEHQLDGLEESRLF